MQLLPEVASKTEKERKKGHASSHPPPYHPLSWPPLVNQPPGKHSLQGSLPAMQS